MSTQSAMRCEEILSLDGKLVAAVGPGCDDVIFLSGSRAEGFSNSRSDHDYYLVTRNRERIAKNASGLWLPGRGIAVSQQFYIVDGQHVELQIWLEDDVASIAEAIRLYSLHPMNEIWGKAVEFFHRLSIARSVWNSSGLSRLRALLDPANLRTYLASFYSRVYEAYSTDAVSAIQNGRPYDAILTSKLALDNALDCYLSVAGQTNPSAKWRDRKLANCEGDIVIKDGYRRLLCGPKSMRSVDLLQFSENTLRFAELVACAALLGSTLLALIPDPDKFKPERIGTRGPNRRLGVRLLRGPGSGLWLVDCADGERTPVNTMAAYVWSLLTGHWSASRIGAQLSKLTGVERKLVVSEISDFIETLVTKGLATPYSCDAHKT